MTQRRLSLVSAWITALSLLACSDDPERAFDASVSEQDARVELAESGVLPVPHIPPATDGDAGMAATCMAGGEFASACPDDAAADTSAPPLDDTSVPPLDAASAPPLDDASATPLDDARADTGCGAVPCGSHDASVVDPPDAQTPGPECEPEAHTCATPFFEVSAQAECAFRGDSLQLSYRVCETCGQRGHILHPHVILRACDSCDLAYAEGGASGSSAGANACLNLRLTTISLAQTAARGCIDVYGLANSSADGFVSVGTHQRRVCRCNVETRRCAACSGDSCGAP